jgi:hypothetical protein
MLAMALTPYPLSENSMQTHPTETSTAAGADEADITVEPHAPARKKKPAARKASKSTTRTLALTAAEFERLAEIKRACAAAGVTVRKTDLIRVALMLLAGAPVELLAQARDALPAVKRK